MAATPEYEKNRLARIARRKAEEAGPLANIRNIASQLLYGQNTKDKQRHKGDDGGSGSEYEPNDDEEADDGDEVSGEEEHEPTVHMSKEKENQPSTKPQGRKRARSKTTVPTTTRTTRASASRLNQTDHTSPNDDTSAHRTSKDSNSPQADTEMQHSQDMTNILRQIDNSDTLRGQDALVCSNGPTNPKTSMRVKRRPTMGQGLDDYAKRNGGMKMKIDFSAGRVRPLDPVQAAKLASQCGVHVRSNIMHVATHWNDYSKEDLAHHIPKAIGHVAKNFEMDPKDEVSKGVCTKILQKGVRQQRYILKRDYFNGRTREEALSRKPPKVSQHNWETLVNKWSDERNKKICAKNKENREGVKHHQTTGSRSYPSHFHQLKKDKYNNEDPSPIEFFKETHTNRKTGCMSTAALEAYTDMENKRSEALEHPVSGTHIVAEVLKEHSSSSTFLSTMGYQSRSGRSRTSASEERVRELEGKVEQQKIEAIEANAMYQQQLNERGKTQEAALGEMQRKQQEELVAMKKIQEEKNKAYEKKQAEQDSLISFLLRKHATQN
ncbi:uncharacterized protein [Lolium perenne]|uniref:uncharacterized protein n=1 Tax=Lolium perenne TaxID=4522 RepID=UPI003A99BB77